MCGIVSPPPKAMRTSPPRSKAGARGNRARLEKGFGTATGTSPPRSPSQIAGSVTASDGNSVLLRLLAILAAVLLWLRAKGLTRRHEDAKPTGRISDWWEQRNSRMAMTDTLAASRLCSLSVSCSGALSGFGDAIRSWRS